MTKINIKNCMCYYFDGIIKFQNFDLDNILIEEKSYKKILVYNISYNTLIFAKPLCNRFEKIYEFITGFHRTRYLVLFGAEKYDSIYNGGIRYSSR